MVEHTESKLIEGKLPCPHCTSSDGWHIYDDGHGFCFSCRTFEWLDGKKVQDVEKENLDFRLGWSHRNISSKSLEHYNVHTSFEGEEPWETGFIYPNGAVKLRNMQEKKFKTKGDMKNAHLFGLDKFEAGGETIVITEGEYDAISVYEALQIPSVSIRSSSSARKDCKAEYSKLNSFKRIILALDSDEAGQRAAKEIAGLFDFNKVYNVVFTKYKDANEYLQKDDSTSLREAVRAAKKYTPDNIISSFDDILSSLKDNKEIKIGTYPFKGLEDRLFGLHKGEVIVFKGDEGIGKTEVFRAMQSHLIKESDENKIGILHLEEDKSTTIKGVVNYHFQYPFLHPEDGTEPIELLKHYREAVKDDDGRLFIYDSFDVDDDTGLIDNLRFLTSACGCNFIFLDHVSWLATGMEGDDERKKLDRITQKLKLLAKEVGFCLVMISHTNDEGKTRGSRNVTKVANTVIHMERDKTSPVDHLRLQTHFTIEKARIAGGQTGKAGFAAYDLESLCLQDGV